MGGAVGEGTEGVQAYYSDLFAERRPGLKTARPGAGPRDRPGRRAAAPTERVPAPPRS